MKFDRTLVFLLQVLSIATLAFPQDAEGSKDHPLLSRMPNYFIVAYNQRDFDRHEFPLKDEQSAAVEGRMTVIQYQIKEGAKPASPLQIIRNCQNALGKLGGKALHERIDGAFGIATIQLKRGAQETWIEVMVGDAGDRYNLTVVEKAEMKQEVEGAETWNNEILVAGRALIYGILFDTDKAELKPESEEALKEIAKLLGQNASLSLWVVGHTDASGDISRNMPLSEARAKAVVAALTAKHGIAAGRLSAYGVGPLCPVAPNDTEEGRAKNRRVELVKH